MYIKQEQDKEILKIKELAKKGYDLMQISNILNIPIPYLLSLDIKISVIPRKEIL